MHAAERAGQARAAMHSSALRISRLGDWLPIRRRPEDLATFEDGLRRAGLSELTPDDRIGPKGQWSNGASLHKEHWFRHSQHQHMMVRNMEASLYEPINVYKPIAPNFGIVDGPFE